MIKAIAFDLFGTVFDPKTVDKHDIVTYVNWIRNKEWRHIDNAILPSFWNIKPFADSVEGLNAIKEAGFKIIAASNWQQAQIHKVSENAGISWDYIIDFAKVSNFKPHLSTYALICQETGLYSDEILMVTGNKGAGDDTAPAKIGMLSLLIRQGAYPDKIINVLDIVRAKEQYE